MSENLKFWDAMKQPPKDALKSIGGGRLKGMTDIKPQWRYKVMTEQFGPCGIGWKYTITKQWSEPGSGGQVLCFTNIDLFVLKDGTDWSEAIPGTGGSMLVEQERNGPHTSDEGYKMSLTDALSVAMSRLGVAADIYMGNWTGSKYKDADTMEPRKEEPKSEPKMSSPSVDSGCEPDENIGLLRTFRTKEEFHGWKKDTGDNLPGEIKGKVMTEYMRLIKEIK